MGRLLSEQDFRDALPEQGLFRGEMPWLLSPKPFELTKHQVKSLQRLGHVLGQFYDACNKIYHAAADGRENEWVAHVLDAGKPEMLVRAQRSKLMRQEVPLVMRPDLILTEEGWIITELDSVPGGQGVTRFLSEIYGKAGWNILGGNEGMSDAFRQAHPNGAAIVVSDESADYLPEMQYFASSLGDGYSCSKDCDFEKRQDEAPPSNESGQPQTVYRFFELFDEGNIPCAASMIEAAAAGAIKMSPPPVPHLEEKLWLALFHAPGLQKKWSKHMRGAHKELLSRLIPHSWVVDPSPLPPLACLPWLNVNSWDEVGEFSQKERRLVLKISGFNELAWGGRGVYVGHDMPTEEWKKALNTALEQFDVSPWVLQEFHSGEVVKHPYFDRESGDVKQMQGRVRVCPYYYRLPGGDVVLGGCLATIVSKEKKKIHGMQDAILVPCAMPQG